MSRADHSTASPSDVRYANINAQSVTPSTSPISQSASPRSPPSWWTRIGVDHWAWELSAAVLCICVLAAIVGVLIAYDQRPVPDLPDGLTINAIIAFLSTLAKSSLTLLVSAAIRQEKWLWFIHRSRPLSTIDSFEEASRGPYGSLVLLLKLRGSTRALLAAAVTVLAIGFDPFVQQLVTISTHAVAIDGALASIQTPVGYYEASTSGTASSALAFTAQIGAFGGVNGTIPAPNCPGGNCTWPQYDSLALCTVCKDMTDEVSVTNAFAINVTSHLVDYEAGNDSSVYQQWHPTYAFPTGLNLTVDVGLSMQNASSTYIGTQWSIDYPRRRVFPLNISPEEYALWNQDWRNETFAGLEAPLFAMGYLDLALTEDSSSLRVQHGVQCVFSPCVRTITTQSVNGVVDSTVSNVDYGHVFFTEQLADGSSIAGGWRTEVNDTVYEIFDKGLTGNAGGNASRLIGAIRTTLEGNTSYSVEGFHYPDGPPESIPAYDSTGYSLGSAWSSTGQQAIDVANDFTGIVDDVGRAITGRFQQLAQTSVAGTATRDEAIVVVRWLWLIYPLALLVLGLGGLLATIAATHLRRMAVWKESTLPLLYRYTGRSPTLDDISEGPGLVDPSAPNQVSRIVDHAQDEMVRLRKHSNVWTLASEGVVEKTPTTTTRTRRTRTNTHNTNANNDSEMPRGDNLVLEERVTPGLLPRRS